MKEKLTITVVRETEDGILTKDLEMSGSKEQLESITIRTAVMELPSMLASIFELPLEPKPKPKKVPRAVTTQTGRKGGKGVNKGKDN